jgi:hypothetical protein
MTSLTLDLPEKTFKKLRALAMLSGKTVPDLEQNLLEYFDAMLSENIQVLLAELDGTEVQQPAPRVQTISTEAPEPEAETETVVPDETAHALSEDDDADENKSLAEQVDEGFVPQVRMPDAGESSDAFLDAALGSGGSPELPQEMRARPAGKSFNPLSRKPRVSEYTGDE